MIWAIVLAAGTGTRFGQHKQFACLGGRRIVDRAVETAASACDAVVVVLPRGVAWDGPPVAVAVAGGETRAASVRHGLSAVPPDAAIIVVHDAAHPLAPRQLFESVISAMGDGIDGAAPVLPVTDTLARVRAGRIGETLPRHGVLTLQVPFAFRAEVLRAAHARHIEASDDVSLVVGLGGTIAVVPGDPRNIHVATPEDLI